MSQQMFYPDQISNAVRIVAGQHTTVAAVDAVPIAGINTITAATATLVSDPSDDLVSVTCTYSAGVLTIKTWKNTSGTDPTPTAATSFSKRVDFVVMGV